MFSAKKTIVAMVAVALAPLSLALPANETEHSAMTWAQFCNDDLCTKGCGISVDIANPGCLNQNGRQSIKFHGGFSPTSYSLVVSAGANCSCQSECTMLNDFLPCMDISRYEWARSFRIQQGGCADNNCEIDG